MSTKMPRAYSNCTESEMSYDGGSADWQSIGEIIGMVAGVAMIAGGVMFACNRCYYDTTTVALKADTNSARFYDYGDGLNMSVSTVNVPVTKFSAGNIAIGASVATIGALGAAASATCLGLHKNGKL